MARQGNGLEMPPNCPTALGTISKHQYDFNFKIRLFCTWKGNNPFQKRNRFLLQYIYIHIFFFLKERYARTEGLFWKAFKYLLPRFQGADLRGPLPGPLTCVRRALGAAGEI